MSDVEPEFAWIEALPHDLARAAAELLDEVIHQISLLATPPYEVRQYPYPRGGLPLHPYDCRRPCKAA